VHHERFRQVSRSCTRDLRATSEVLIVTELRKAAGCIDPKESATPSTDRLAFTLERTEHSFLVVGAASDRLSRSPPGAGLRPNTMCCHFSVRSRRSRWDMLSCRSRMSPISFHSRLRFGKRGCAGDKCLHANGHVDIFGRKLGEGEWLSSSRPQHPTVLQLTETSVNAAQSYRKCLPSMTSFEV
jgi:hypothetical protein